MKYKLGNSKNIFQVAVCPGFICPKCGKAVDFPVYSNKNVGIKGKAPFLDFKRVYFGVCGECSSIFIVPSAAGKCIAKGDFSALRGLDLTEPGAYLDGR